MTLPENELPWNQPNPILADDKEGEEAEQDKTGDDEEEVVKISKAEYEKLVKKAEALDPSTKEAQLQNEAIKIYKDKTNFVKLYERSPKIAQQVADKFFDGVNAKEAYERLKGETPAKSTVSDEDIDEKVDRLLEKKEAEKTLTKLRKETGIDKDSKLGQKLQEEYEDLIEGKRLNSEKVKKYFQTALMTVKNIPKYAEEFEKNKVLGGIGQGKAPSGAKEIPAIFKEERPVTETRFKKK